MTTKRRADVWRGRIRGALARHYSLAGAAEALGQLRAGSEVVVLSHGQFSLSDVLEEIVRQVGPAEVSLATWTAAGADTARMVELVEGGAITGMRWVVDSIFVRRQPALVRSILGRWPDGVRILKTHAKFALVLGPRLAVTLRTSMNLNANPRLELVEVTVEAADKAAMFGFFRGVVDRIFEAGSAAGRVALSDVASDESERRDADWWG